jgi:hypothetical protein
MNGQMFQGRMAPVDVIATQTRATEGPVTLAMQSVAQAFR